MEVFQRLVKEVQTQSTHRVLMQPPDRGNASGNDTNAFSPGARLAWRYEIVETCGQGGFGLVYKALDQQRNNLAVAIKQINLAHLNPQDIIEATDSYNREIQHLSKLRHENLPRIYDHFTDQQHWYIVMEYIHGKTFEDVLANGMPLPENEAIEIGITLCSVLSYLHAQNPPVIFRDVKPANIMRTRTGHLYLIDFGIARHYIEGKRHDTRPLGSPGYAAPEQYGKAQTTIQTDIYGLGATLQYLLTGKDPHDSLSATNDEHLPTRLRPLLKQMLARDSAQRPHNMGEVKDWLMRIRDAGL